MQNTPTNTYAVADIFVTFNWWHHLRDVCTKILDLPICVGPAVCI